MAQVRFLQKGIHRRDHFRHGPALPDPLAQAQQRVDARPPQAVQSVQGLPVGILPVLPQTTGMVGPFLLPAAAGNAPENGVIFRFVQQVPVQT